MLLLLVAAPLPAQEAGGSLLSAAADAGEWTVGDRIGFTLLLVPPPDLEAALPEVGSEPMSRIQQNDQSVMQILPGIAMVVYKLFPGSRGRL